MSEDGRKRYRGFKHLPVGVAVGILSFLIRSPLHSCGQVVVTLCSVAAGGILELSGLALGSSEDWLVGSLAFFMFSCGALLLVLYSKTQDAINARYKFVGLVRILVELRLVFALLFVTVVFGLFHAAMGYLYVVLVGTIDTRIYQVLGLVVFVSAFVGSAAGLAGSIQWCVDRLER